MMSLRTSALIERDMGVKRMETSTEASRVSRLTEEMRTGEFLSGLELMFSWFYFSKMASCVYTFHLPTKASNTARAVHFL